MPACVLMYDSPITNTTSSESVLFEMEGLSVSCIVVLMACSIWLCISGMLVNEYTKRVNESLGKYRL